MTLTRHRPIALASVALGGAFLLTAPIPAYAAVLCSEVPVVIWAQSVSRENDEPELIAWSPDPDTGALTEIRRVPSPRPYGDIAISADGTRMFAVDFGYPAQLYAVDMETGEEFSSTTIAPEVAAANLLAFSRDGMLYIGTNGIGAPVRLLDPFTAQIVPGEEITLPLTPVEPYVCDPDVDPFCLPFEPDPPGPLVSSGDVITLSDGDLLISTYGSAPGSWLVRVDAETGEAVVVGTIPSVWGLAGLDGNRFYTAGYDGVLSLATGPFPETFSTDPIALTPVTSVAPNRFWGATSPRDAGPCIDFVGEEPPPALAATGAAFGWPFALGSALFAVLAGLALVRRRDARSAPAQGAPQA